MEIDTFQMSVSREYVQKMYKYGSDAIVFFRRRKMPAANAV